MKKRLLKDPSIILIYIYIYIALFSLLVFVLTAITSKGQIIRLMSFGEQLESDYFRQIVYASDLKNIYFNTSDAPFPPFTYLFYHLLYIINPFESSINLDAYIIAKEHGINSIIYVLLMSIKIMLLYKSVEKHLNNKYSSIVIYTFVTMTLMSIPFLFGAIDRGNIILLVDVLLLFALYFKDTNNNLYKEIALIFISISAAIKVYPAIVGLIYIKEKRYKEAIRLIIYGILFFFIPFVFAGGIPGLIQYIKVLSSFGNSTIPRWTSIGPIIYAIADAIKMNYSINTLQFFITIISILIVLLNTISFFKSNNNVTSFVMLFSLMSICVPDSYRYTAIYMLVPFVYLLKETNKRKINYVYLVLFSMIFTIPVLAYFINVTVIDLFIYAPIYLCCLISYIDIWFLNQLDSFVV